MPLLKSGEFVDDPWVMLGEDEPVPQGASIIVPFDRLEAEFETLKEHNGALGVLFPNDREEEDLKPYLDRLETVALEFPKFADGRAYSQARVLRSQLGFEGELRATGNVLPDQIAFMRQCGFDAFEADERIGLEAWQRSATAMTVAYQRGYGPERGFAPVNALNARKEHYDD